MPEIGEGWRPLHSVRSISSAVRLVAGTDWACVLNTAGSVACFGSGLDEGRTVVDSVSDLTANPFVACALRRGDVHCWAPVATELDGSESEGTINRPMVPTCGEVDCGPVPRQLTRFGDVIRIESTEYNYVCALRRSGAVHCWGSGPTALMDIEFALRREEWTATAPVRIRSLGAVSHLWTAGAGTFCAPDARGTISCWGLGASWPHRPPQVVWDAAPTAVRVDDMAGAALLVCSREHRMVTCRSPMSTGPLVSCLQPRRLTQ